MNRTELNDLAPVGDELDESALHGISGGRPREPLGTYVNPPGICLSDD
ncbi:hypothetical protein [Planomonospora venezuelensis]|uniref:Uncharacterized protein n=1 Tax=Planomonospora venezuelensis TaxID=1999 RepID=A0A841D4Q5_PLAVE|nr:hypothetical protein [Planomonospora venezuelensis]MBB5963943.1 hypothetical protein [Planomonospora venezuelensis]GIN03891.1 hypothetical protein Pve01_55490 [Planomonospora venezuelensis]